MNKIDYIDCDPNEFGLSVKQKELGDRYLSHCGHYKRAEYLKILEARRASGEISELISDEQALKQIFSEALNREYDRCIREGRYIHDAEVFVTGPWKLPKRGGVPTAEVEAEELIIPYVEISSLPIDEIKQKRFLIVERAQGLAKDSLQRQEDIEIFKVINASVGS